MDMSEKKLCATVRVVFDFDLNNYQTVNEADAMQADVELPIDTPEKAAKIEALYLKDGHNDPMDIVGFGDEESIDVKFEVVDVETYDDKVEKAADELGPYSNPKNEISDRFTPR